MIEFIDKTSESQGTPINRENLMAVQGFDSIETLFDTDEGDIVEINSKGEKLITIFRDDGSIVEKFIGEKTITKTTTFNDDGSILEVVS